jgi:hypothetical protein
MMCASVPDTAVCLVCGYSLRGLPEPVCPECGRVFDPADPATFKDLDEPTLWSRWARPPSIIEMIIAAVIAAGVIHLGSIPFRVWPPDITALLAGVFPCLILLAVTSLVISYLLRSIMTYRSDRPIGRTTKVSCRRWRWSVLPLCIILVATVLIYPWPLRLRFGVSRRSFERAAESALRGALKIQGQEWIGLYRVNKVYFGDGEVAFVVHDWPIDGAYFAYGPTAGNDTAYRHVPGTEKWFMCKD